MRIGAWIVTLAVLAGCTYLAMKWLVGDKEKGDDGESWTHTEKD